MNIWIGTYSLKPTPGYAFKMLLYLDLRSDGRVWQRNNSLFNLWLQTWLWIREIL